MPGAAPLASDFDLASRARRRMLFCDYLGEAKIATLRVCSPAGRVAAGRVCGRVVCCGQLENEAYLKKRSPAPPRRLPGASTFDGAAVAAAVAADRCRLRAAAERAACCRVGRVQRTQLRYSAKHLRCIGLQLGCTGLQPGCTGLQPGLTGLQPGWIGMGLQRSSDVPHLQPMADRAHAEIAEVLAREQHERGA